MSLSLQEAVCNDENKAKAAAGSITMVARKC